MDVIARKPGRPADPGLKSRREDEILDAAAKLFAEQGYAETDTQQLADLLQVGKGTIYRYFPSKRELFLAAVDRVMSRLTAFIDFQVEGRTDPMDVIAGAIEAYLTFFSGHPEAAELLIQERAQFKDREKPTYFKHRDANVERRRHLFENLVASGRVRNLPVDRICDVISDLVYGTMFTNYFTGRRAAPAYQARDILDLLFRGLFTDAERARTAHDSAPVSRGWPAK